MSRSAAIAQPVPTFLYLKSSYKKKGHDHDHPPQKNKTELTSETNIVYTSNTGVGSDEFPFGARPPDRCELLVFGSLNVRLFSCLEKHMKNKTCSLN